MTPKEAKTFEQICKLPRDNVESGDFSIVLGSQEIYLAEQRPGEDRKQHIEIPRLNFNALVKWYLTGRKR